jgi:hypothetical protein
MMHLWFHWIIPTKEKNRNMLALSFPVGIGNKSYDDLANNDMSVRVLLMSGKDSVFKAVSYESMEIRLPAGNEI